VPGHPDQCPAHPSCAYDSPLLASSATVNKCGSITVLPHASNSICTLGPASSRFLSSGPSYTCAQNYSDNSFFTKSVQPPHFYNPVGDATSLQFRQVTTTRDPRLVQFGLQVSF